nr:galactose-1-phosphate uridylyltransferase [Sphingobacterium daejeonense]
MSEEFVKFLHFTPRHDLTLPEMDVEDIKKVVDVWQSEFTSLASNEWVKYIQIFENKGSIMGCSNPHPHGQIWAESKLPMEILKEEKQQQEYFLKNKKSLLSDYLALELEKKERIIIDNEHFVALVPFWAAWPFETLLISKRQVTDITEFSEEEKFGFSKNLTGANHPL